ncbi:MAG: exopolysaccharide biosynthesis protein [Pseudomonadota bacterium]
MTKAMEMIDTLDAAAEDDADGTGRVRLGDLAQELGRRGVGAFIMVPAALELTPIGGLPGVPTILALIVSIFCAQIALGREHMWLPTVLENRTVSAKRLGAAAERLAPAARWADRHLGRHLTALVRDPAPRIAALAVIALCCAVPLLELVPFASSIPMGTAALFGLALVMGDGRVMALAGAAFLAALFGIATLWP